MIPYGRQEIIQEDIDAVAQVLRSDFLTQGPMVPRFEGLVAKYSGASYAVAANSATSALHVACLALELGPGDWLWTSPITFVATANCALYCGAQVDFVDIDPKTYNLSVDALEKKLISAEREGRLPRVVIPVHMCGQSCDMRAIHDLGQRYGFRIIEDASHAIGGKYLNDPIGSCRYSDITIFSFHPVKIITTAEGGLALTNDSVLADKMRLLRSHGITRDSELMTRPADGPWYYQQIALGFNYRMTELQAALGVSQMERLDQYVTRRHELSNRYDTLLSALPITMPWQHPDSYSSRHLYVIRLNLNEIRSSRRGVFEYLRERDIGANVHYIPIHLQPYYQALGFRQGDYRQAEDYYEEAISLPLYPTMSEAQQNYVVDVLSDFLTQGLKR